MFTFLIDLSDIKFAEYAKVGAMVPQETTGENYSSQCLGTEEWLIRNIIKFKNKK